MKTHLLFSLLIATVVGHSQLKSPPSGGNKKAMVSEMVGITDITIRYDRPGVKGREGKIYGTDIVHEGFADFGFEDKAPWRAGANENTTIEFSTPVKIEGNELPAGKYGLFVAYGKEESIIIFSKNSTSWGSYHYQVKEDALRVKVKPVASEKSVEWLKYEFVDQTENAAVIALQWEKLSFRFKVEADLVNTSLQAFRDELRGEKGFTWEANHQAAAFCLDHNVNLTEGLKWAKYAVFYGKNFTTLMTRSELHEKLNEKSRADSLSAVALKTGTMPELHNYARSLLRTKENKKALEVFKYNAEKHPGEFMTYTGLARGYSANGDFRSALVNAKKALPLAPDENNKKSIETMIGKLEKSTDIN